MTRTLSGKRAILTGASGGIGRALAAALVKAGARVALASRNAAALEALAADLRGEGGETVVVPTDVTQPEERKRLVETTARQFGGLDLVINNAGVGSWGHFATSTPEIMQRVMEVNFFAPVELTRVAMPLLTNGNQSAVVNIASMCGRKGMPAWSEYSASKHALVGIAEALRGEFARFDVDVITVIPGLTNSGFEKNWLRSEGRANLQFETGMTPEFLATKILDAIRANRREVVFGSEARTLLRFNRFFPRLTNRLIARNVKKLYGQ